MSEEPLLVVNKEVCLCGRSENIDAEGSLLEGLTKKEVTASHQFRLTLGTHVVRPRPNRPLRVLMEVTLGELLSGTSQGHFRTVHCALLSRRSLPASICF